MASNGPPVLLLHGFATSYASTWVSNGWVDLLQEAGREVIGVDLLGHGEAPKPKDPNDYATLEQRVVDELPSGEVDAVGFSMGARVLLTIASWHPDRFRRLVVAGVGANLFERDVEHGKAIVEAIRTGVGDSPETQYFANLPDAPDADREALGAFLARPGGPELDGEALAKITAPTLVVLGDQDFAGPADPLVDALPDATHHVLRGVDHFATPKDFGFIDAALTHLDAQPF